MEHPICSAQEFRLYPAGNEVPIEEFHDLHRPFPDPLNFRKLVLVDV